VDAKNSVALLASRCSNTTPLRGGFYAAQLALYLAYYESSQFAVISFRGYLTQTDAMLRQVGSLLGLESHINRPQLAALGSAMLGALAQTDGDAPQAVHSSIRAHARTMKASRHNTAALPHSLDPDAHRALDMFYEPSIRDLGVLLHEHTNKGMAVLPRGIFYAVCAATSPLETARALLSVSV
jgi:hypothetical protein